MTERRLSSVLTQRVRRVAWTALAGYGLVVVAAFAVAAEIVLGRSLDHSAAVIESLLGSYSDSTGAPGGVMPEALAEQLVGMGGQVVITRTTTNAGGMPEVYYISPGMPARRLEGLPPDASADAVRRMLLAAITQRARWRYRATHRSAGAFDIYVGGSREPYALALAALAGAAALLLPIMAIGAGRRAEHAIAETLRPLDRVTEETRGIGPADLGKRLTSPTGQAEVTELAESVNRMLDRVDRAHRALESFTADASHELRTPLTHLRAQVQWAAAEGRHADQVREALTAMERELDRTAKMVEELLLIARGENQQLRLTRVSFELGAVMGDVAEITQAMVSEREIVVRAEADEPAWALGDPDRARHILLNLASNAARYTSSGTITFSIRRNGGMVGAAIQDTGPGIASGQLQRIFDRFFRIDQSRSRDLGGAGLGLAIARLLAELQDGKVMVDSTPGEGSTFTLWLPSPGETA